MQHTHLCFIYQKFFTYASHIRNSSHCMYTHTHTHTHSCNYNFVFIIHWLVYIRVVYCFKLLWGIQLSKHSCLCHFLYICFCINLSVELLCHKVDLSNIIRNCQTFGTLKMFHFFPALFVMINSDVILLLFFHI